MANVMCSKGTTYTDVAARMYAAEGLLPAAEYALFHRLTNEGITVAKGLPSGGKPAKTRRFRLSFVDSRLFFTWEARGVTSGIDIGQVLEVRAKAGPIRQSRAVHSGAASPPSSEPAARPPPAPEDEERDSGDDGRGWWTVSLAVPASTRTLDLFLPSWEDRDIWLGMMRALVAAEHGAPKRSSLYGDDGGRDAGDSVGNLDEGNMEPHCCCCQRGGGCCESRNGAMPCCGAVAGGCNCCRMGRKADDSARRRNREGGSSGESGGGDDDWEGIFRLARFVIIHAA
ncbi:unnamed protein product [Phaeothamnion confervicola]